MTRLLIILLLFVPSVTGIAQDANAIFREGEKLEAAFQESDAFLKYARVLQLQPNNMAALCKCSDLSSRIGNREPDKTKKAAYFKSARSYAEAALKINPNDSRANFEMAVSMGCMAMVTSGKEKVIAVNEIRNYANKAIQQDPHNFQAYYILGRWNYEVSNLSAIERTLAKWLFGGLAEASLEECIRCHEKCRTINAAFVLNYMELAKAYKRDGRKEKAKECLNLMLVLPNTMLDDINIKITAKRLLQEWE